ncbi:unnamed protein product [Didymodactylos carnosus]|uniref:Ubiquitin-like domain-containing protein n=1 Tax=Didymodactylos carnosus TaxID=1234261 RepID=A0A8S2EUM9_9BILA|nr:unnamed protein product [Didymodactylos carnosus]CAF4052113.1 unnamed protein product [Didymodactylos carnosus]
MIVSTNNPLAAAAISAVLGLTPLKPSAAPTASLDFVKIYSSVIPSIGGPSHQLSAICGHYIQCKDGTRADRQVRIILSTGKAFELDLIFGESVRQLKNRIQNQEGIDVRCQVILKGDKVLTDDELIADCLKGWHEPLNVKIMLAGPLALDNMTLAPEFDYDFTDIVDKGTLFTRGNHPYERPCGSKRIALNVAGRYGSNDRWLGMTGTDSEEWPVSYHGTGKHNAMNIAEEGFKLSKCKRFLYGRGIYSTPELDVAKGYATEFEYEGQRYYVLLQNRVNPKYLKVISDDETGVGTYWVSSKGPDDSDNDMADLIRPYGLCIFQAFRTKPTCCLQ